MKVDTMAMTIDFGTPIRNEREANRIARVMAERMADILEAEGHPAMIDASYYHSPFHVHGGLNEEELGDGDEWGND